MLSCTEDPTIGANQIFANSRTIKSHNGSYSPCLTEVEINSTLLPQVISDYLSSNYPSISILKIESLSEIGLTNTPVLYEVELATGVELLFDIDGTLIASQEVENEAILDVNGLDKIFLDYIKARYPDNTIDEITAETEFDVSLIIIEMDSLEVIFNADGTFLCEKVEVSEKDSDSTESSDAADNENDSSGSNDDSDSDTTDSDSDTDAKDSDNDVDNDVDNDSSGSTTDTENSVSIGSLPSNITAYIQANYPSVNIKDAEKEGQEYHIKLDNGEELIFDLNGNFLRKGD